MKKLRSRKKKKKSNKTKDPRATEIEQEPNVVLESVASDSKQPQPESVSKQPELDDESDMRIDIPTSASASKESMSTLSSSRLKNSTDCESSPFSPPSSRSKNSTDYESSPFSTPSSIAKTSTESSPFSPSSSSSYSSINNKLKFRSYMDAVTSISPVEDNKKKKSDSPLISPEKKSLISPGVKGKRKLLEPTNNPRIELSDQESWDEALDQLWALGPIFSDKHNYDGVNEVDYESCYKSAHDLSESAKSYLEEAKSLRSLGRDIEAENYEKMSNDAKTQAREQTRIASTTMYLSRQNKRKREQEVDLHGQHRDIALRIIKTHMCCTCLTKSVDDYKVITGHGGGEHGEPVIRTEVTTFLDANDIRWHFEDKEGTVCFRLDGSTKKLKM